MSESASQMKRLLTAKEAAHYVGLSAKCLYNRVNDGTLPVALKPIRTGKRGWRWDRVRIDAWLEAERHEAERAIAGKA